MLLFDRLGFVIRFQNNQIPGCSVVHEKKSNSLLQTIFCEPIQQSDKPQKGENVANFKTKEHNSVFVC